MHEGTEPGRPRGSPAPNGMLRRKNACWATLFTDERYLPCLAVFVDSLARHRSRYPLVVMVTEQVDSSTRALLTRLGCTVRSIQRWEMDIGDVRRCAANAGRHGVCALHQRLDQVARI